MFSLVQLSNPEGTCRITLVGCGQLGALTGANSDYEAIQQAIASEMPTRNFLCSFKVTDEISYEDDYHAWLDVKGGPWELSANRTYAKLRS